MSESALQRVRVLQKHISASPCSGDEKLPKRVVVTGAAGQIAYSLLFQVATGRMLGLDQPLDLVLLDIPPAMGALKGVVMELEDGAFSLVKSITATSDAREAFTGAEVVLMVGAMPRKEGMERSDLLQANAKIFFEQGRILNAVASRDVKVCVVGNPANTNCLAMAQSAPSIPRENFTALTRLDQNRAYALVASKAGIPVSHVRNIIIWGNHSATQFPDLSHAVFVDSPLPGMAESVESRLNDPEWTANEFVPRVQKRGAEVIAARKLSSAASAANAIVEHCHDWLVGTPPGVMVSMGVISDGSYGIEKGLVYSFPVTCCNGNYSIVQGLPISSRAQQLMRATEDELRREKEQVAALGGR